MANTITDNRTLIDAADTAGTVWVDIADAAAAVDTEIKVEGTGSVGEFCTTTRAGTFYKFAADTDLSNNHIYMWFNCGIVGLLATKANSGLTFRARGPTITNFLEWDIAGSDDYPPTFEGGWTMIVVDLESTPTRTGGTPPLTTAIRSIGMTFITASVMPRMADNCWVDEVRRLPDGSPGIIVQGRNGGATDWKWSDLPTELTSDNGTAIAGPAGSILLNTPVEFFVDDASVHAFSSLNEVVLWEDKEFAAADLYKITVLGAASGSSDWKMGAKTGSGAAATGAQGGSIIADSAGVRWDFDGDIANIDSCNLYGVAMVHGGDFQVDAAAIEVITSLFVDTTSVEASNSNAFLKNSYLNANSAADTGNLVWNENVDVDGILDGSIFEQGAAAHHAIDFGTAVAVNLTLRNCAFNGFSGTDDVNGSTFRFLATSGALNLSLVNCTVDGAAVSQANIGVDDAAGITVTVVIDPVTVLVNVKDNNAANLINTRVLLEASDGTGDFPFEETVTITRAGATASVAHTAHGLVNGDIVVIRGADQQEYNGPFSITNVTTNAYDYTVSGSPTTPATGTITSSGAILSGLTDASGNISVARTFTLSTPVKGAARKSSASPRFKDFSLAGTISNSGGLTINIRLILDE